MKSVFQVSVYQSFVEICSIWSANLFSGIAHFAYLCAEIQFQNQNNLNFAMFYTRNY